MKNKISKKKIVKNNKKCNRRDCMSLIGVIVVAIIGFLGICIQGNFDKQIAMLPIEATQSAEANVSNLLLSTNKPNFPASLLQTPLTPTHIVDCIFYYF